MLRWVYFISDFPKDDTQVLLATVNPIVSPPLLNDVAVLVPKPKKKKLYCERPLWGCLG